jgi:MscS family membrane protein
VESIFLEQVRSNPLAAQYPEPRARFRKFGDSSLDFELLCRSKRPLDRGRLMHALNAGIYNAFAEAGIKIPFPQRDVHLTTSKKARDSGFGEWQKSNLTNFKRKI